MDVSIQAVSPELICALRMTEGSEVDGAGGAGAAAGAAAAAGADAALDAAAASAG
jgi:hypothetical protein